MLRRLRNLWLWSGIFPEPGTVIGANKTREISNADLKRFLREPAKIIRTNDPADELMQAIRKENTGQA